MLKFRYVKGYGLKIDKNDSRNWKEVDDEELGGFINHAYYTNDNNEYLLVLVNFYKIENVIWL